MVVFFDSCKNARFTVIFLNVFFQHVLFQACSASKLGLRRTKPLSKRHGYGIIFIP